MVVAQQVGDTLVIFDHSAFPFQPLLVEHEGLVHHIIRLGLTRGFLFGKVRIVEEGLLALLLSLDRLLVENMPVAIVELSGGVLDVQAVELGHELLVVSNFEAIEEELDVHVAARVKVLVDLDGDVD